VAGTPETLRAWASFAYLVTIGSFVAFTAYVWLLKASTPARVSTYAFVNPVVAVLLGWALDDEPLTPATLAGAGVIVAGVMLITLGRFSKSRS
jgi:drug/metabolite transporter (DMT)-like permease